jgi:hypothetical protein
MLYGFQGFKSDFSTIFSDFLAITIWGESSEAVTRGRIRNFAPFSA